jgi:hypothetical protein
MHAKIAIMLTWAISVTCMLGAGTCHVGICNMHVETQHLFLMTDEPPSLVRVWSPARVVNTTGVIQGSVWNPRPNHRTQWLQMGVKLLTNSGHSFAPGTSTAGTVRLAQVRLVCVHGLSVVAAHSLPHT